MLVNLFSSEKKQPESLQRSVTIPVNDEKLSKQNERLKKHIDMLYHILVDKEARIFRLKKFIREELYWQKKPEFDDNYSSLEEQLNNLFQDTEDYDPRHKNLGDTNVFSKAPNGQHTAFGNNNLKKTLAHSVDNTAAKRTEENKVENNHLKLDKKLESSVNSLVVNQEQFSISDKSLSDKSLSDKDKDQVTASLDISKSNSSEERRYRLSLPKKKIEIKTAPIKPLENETVLRHLFSFELELKEYSPLTFESVKQFVSKPKPIADEIHEEIERLAEVAAKQKYFQKIFPEETKEKLAYELECYVFEILYPKLFSIDDDVRGFAQQFQDRLNVLKYFITFEILEIHPEMRKEILYVPAIKEFRKINQFKAPTWKIQAFQNCVNHILNVFNETLQRSPNSDELFPVLVYIVLHSNVDFVKYNVDFIYSYLRKCHLMCQLGFLIVNLKAVIQFLQDLNGNSLGEGKLEMKKF